jgi:hypothetical protein
MLTILIVLMMMMIGALIHVIDYVHYLNLFIFGLIKWFLNWRLCFFFLFLFIFFIFIIFISVRVVLKGLQ